MRRMSVSCGGGAIRRLALVGLPSAAAFAIALPQAMAQTQLPGIVVTTPSPVVRQPAARPAPSPQAPSAAAPASPQPPTTQPSAAVVAESEPPPGSIIVVDDAFVPITVATDREVLATAGPTITDTLGQKPGIIGSTFAPGANRPVVRGLDTYRVRTQENGVGSHDVAALSEDHGVPIDPFSAERIEVVRGPATLRYGSQAIGGVVSVENNRIPMFIPPKGFTAEVKGGLNSVDMGRDGAMQVTAGAGNFAVHVDTFRRRNFDYDTPQGIAA